jgi:hypothetical protein
MQKMQVVVKWRIICALKVEGVLPDFKANGLKEVFNGVE